MPLDNAATTAAVSTSFVLSVVVLFPVATATPLIIAQPT